MAAALPSAAAGTNCAGRGRARRRNARTVPHPSGAPAANSATVAAPPATARPALDGLVLLSAVVHAPRADRALDNPG